MVKRQIYPAIYHKCRYAVHEIKRLYGRNDGDKSRHGTQNSAINLHRNRIRSDISPKLLAKECFIFDDIYLGILAKKLNIEPFHSAQFWFHRKYPYKVRDFTYTVASHEFSDPKELERVWNEQKQAGNA